MATEEDVRQLFDYYGDVLHVNVLRDRKSNRSTGSAFVTYGCTEEADAAILALQGVYNMERDKPLQVSYCEKTPNISRFGFNHAQELANQNQANPRPRPVAA
jgi:RNA recognition motif-containing protein